MEISSLATKRKETTSEFDPGMSSKAFEVLNLLSYDVLLAIAHACDIDIGERTSARTKIIKRT